MVPDLNLLPLVLADVPTVKNTYIILPVKQLVGDGPLAKTGGSSGDTTSSGFLIVQQLRKYWIMLDHYLLFAVGLRKY